MSCIYQYFVKFQRLCPYEKRQYRFIFYNAAYVIYKSSIGITFDFAI